MEKPLVKYFNFGAMTKVALIDDHSIFCDSCQLLSITKCPIVLGVLLPIGSTRLGIVLERSWIIYKIK